MTLQGVTSYFLGCFGLKKNVKKPTPRHYVFEQIIKFFVFLCVARLILLLIIAIFSKIISWFAARPRPPERRHQHRHHRHRRRARDPNRSYRFEGRHRFRSNRFP